MEPYQQLSKRVARAVADQIARKPDSNLGLPTGQSPLLTYAILAAWSSGSSTGPLGLMSVSEGDLDADAPAIDWSGVQCFALDEYLEVDYKHTFQAFLEEHLYSLINLPLNNRLSPATSENYDEVIESCGGLDLTILGIGNNGHIAFNEPGTAQSSWTHCAWLDESTRLANQTAFGGDMAAVPHRCITMGLQTIFASKHIILMASSERKRDIVERAFNGPITIDVPASILQLHPNLDVWTDFEFERKIAG